MLCMHLHPLPLNLFDHIKTLEFDVAFLCQQDKKPWHTSSTAAEV